MSQIKIPKKNNLEWLRLLFAWQVVIEHTGAHLNVNTPSFLSHFPGVPAFFFVSGLLIYTSYSNAPGGAYFENRFLRLFPALLFVTIGGGVVALVSHGFNDFVENPSQYIAWGLAQITLGQAYNPSFFRDVGVGVINGSLWTITTEVLFYIAIPFIFCFERRYKNLVIILIIASFITYISGPYLFSNKIYRDRTVFDILSLTPITWGWMFGLGILVAKHQQKLQKITQFLPILILPFLLIILVDTSNFQWLFASSGNRVGIAYFICYSGLIYWLAFGTPYLKLPIDISYGTYIWHMPIVNLLLVLELPNMYLSLTLTFLFATTSWYLIEKPALMLKKRSIKPITK